MVRLPHTRGDNHHHYTGIPFHAVIDFNNSHTEYDCSNIIITDGTTTTIHILLLRHTATYVITQRQSRFRQGGINQHIETHTSTSE
jgi:hypothetical protein